MNFSPAIKDASWPKWDENKLVKNEVEYAIQINNKIITKLNIPTSYNNEQIEEIAKSNEKIVSALNGKTIVKIIIILLIYMILDTVKEFLIPIFLLVNFM